MDGDQILYPLDENAGTAVGDTSGNGRNATVSVGLMDAAGTRELSARARCAPTPTSCR